MTTVHGGAGIEASPGIGVSIRSLRSADVGFAAELHRHALPHGFFPQLGLRFMRAYYMTFVRSPHAVSLLAERNGEPVGVLVGTIDPGIHYRFLVRRFGIRLAAIGGAALVIRPALALWFVKTRARRYLRGFGRMALSGVRNRTGPGAGQDDARQGVLTHVAVIERARGTGAGAGLVATFVEHARRAGAERLRLVTRSETSAAGFYDHLGWTSVRKAPGVDGVVFEHFALDL